MSAAIGTVTITCAAHPEHNANRQNECDLTTECPDCVPSASDARYRRYEPGSVVWLRLPVYLDGMAQEFALERGFAVADAAELDAVLEKHTRSPLDYTAAWMYSLEWRAVKWAREHGTDCDCAAVNAYCARSDPKAGQHED